MLKLTLPLPVRPVAAPSFITLQERKPPLLFLRLVYLGPACALLVLYDVVTHDGLVTARADTNVGDATAGELL